jgi:hypothetical protein
MISRRSRAERYGYINRALPVDELTPFVEKLAHRIALFPAHAIAHGKAAVDAGAFSCMAEGLLAEVHESDLSAASEVTQVRVTEALKIGAGDGSFIQTFPDKITGECVLFLFRGEDGCNVLRARLGTQITPICILQCYGDRNGILVASRGRHIVGLSPQQRSERLKLCGER